MNCLVKFKFQVYNAISVSQLLYGFNILSITEAVYNRLDAFQLRGMRHILGIEHAYYSRFSNEEVFEKMNLALNKALK